MNTVRPGVPGAERNGADDGQLHEKDGKQLTDEQLNGVSGGVGRTGPGTQTEDDIYVGRK
jgi:hypothetical protein